MPLDDAYHEQLKSNFADLCEHRRSPGGQRDGGVFLSRFTEAYPWAHLDNRGYRMERWRSEGGNGPSGAAC